MGYRQMGYGGMLRPASGRRWGMGVCRPQNTQRAAVTEGIISLAAISLACARAPEKLSSQNNGVPRCSVDHMPDVWCSRSGDILADRRCCDTVPDQGQQAATHWHVIIPHTDKVLASARCPMPICMDLRAEGAEDMQGSCGFINAGTPLRCTHDERHRVSGQRG